jgi:phage-related protein (TIGR01555 family)
MPRTRAPNTPRQALEAKPAPSRRSKPIAAEDEAPKPRKLVTDTHVSRSARRPTPLVNPYTLPAFPPGVKPEKETGMAMDDAFAGEGTSLTWAFAQVSTSMWSEGLQFLGYAYLAQLAQRPEYRVFSETNATEMTRKWIRIQGKTAPNDKKNKKQDQDDDERGDDDPATDAAPDAPKGPKGGEDKTDKIAELTDYMDRLKVKDRFRECAEKDGYFGRMHLYIDVNGSYERPAELKIPIGDGRDDLSKAKITKGTTIELRTVEPQWCYPTNYNATNPLAKDWYKPEFWYCMAREIHVSRMLPFVGREVPDLLKPAYGFGGLSMSQMAKPYVDNWLRTRQSVSDMIKAFSVMVLGTNLGTSLQADGDQLFKRLALFSNLRDNNGTMVLDKDTEEFSNVSAPLGGLHELQAQSQEHMCTVSRIPTVKLLGIQPQGLNADSEGVTRTYYDTIAAYQERFFGDHLRTVFYMAQRCLWGEVDPDLTFVFLPLFSLTEKEQSEKRKGDAETAQVLIDTGVIRPEEERRRVAADPESLYPGLDPEDAPDLIEEEMGGLVPKGGGGGGLAGAEVKSGDDPDAGDGRREVAEDSIVPFGHRGGRIVELAGDVWLNLDAWEESKHPRDDDGKFGEGGGGASPGGATAGAGEPVREKREVDSFKSKKELIGYLLEHGVTAKQVLEATGWPSVSMPQAAKAARMNLRKVKEGATSVYYGTPMSEAEIAAITPAVRKNIRSGKGPAARSSDSWSLVEHLAATGGISDKDPLVNDLRQIIGKKNLFVPGFGMLIRPKGNKLDQARESSVEAGYISDAGFRGEGLATSTVNTLLESIDTEMRGQKQYKVGYEPPADTSRQLDDIERSLDTELEQADIPAGSVTGKLRERIIEMMHMEQVGDPLEAYERAVMEQTEAGVSDDEGYERIPDDIEGWDALPDDERAAP